MTSTKKKYIRYAIYAILLGLMIWPTSRVFFQQQLMKIGFFQPKFEEPVTEEASVEESTNVAGEDKASFVNENGDIINTADLKGKVVFINFWATWCGPCVAEMPSIEVLYNKFKSNPDVVFLIVEIESNQDGVKEFLAKHKLDLPIVYPNGNIPSTWLENAIPTTVILDKDGQLAERKQGMYDYSGQGVQDFIQSLLNK